MFLCIYYTDKSHQDELLGTDLKSFYTASKVFIMLPSKQAKSTVHPRLCSCCCPGHVDPREVLNCLCLWVCVSMTCPCLPQGPVLYGAYCGSDRKVQKLATFGQITGTREGVAASWEFLCPSLAAAHVRPSLNTSTRCARVRSQSRRGTSAMQH